MIRGTTPIHVFNKLPVISAEIAEIWITYCQHGKEILNKTKESGIFVDNEEEESCYAEVHLDQEDTLKFTQGPATVQVRLLLVDGTAMATDEVPLDIKRIVKNGIIQ